MTRPARATGGRRGLRVVHALMRIVLVCALVILLALIAMREVQGITRAAVPAHHAAGAPTTALVDRAGGSA